MSGATQICSSNVSSISARCSPSPPLTLSLSASLLPSTVHSHMNTPACIVCENVGAQYTHAWKHMQRNEKEKRERETQFIGSDAGFSFSIFARFSGFSGFSDAPLLCYGLFRASGLVF